MIVRQGWRGPITNKIKKKIGKNRIEQYKLDPTLNWHLAQIISVTSSEIGFKSN